eukprot:scaffold739_cov166-Pinguiococcus_pyrenoidosus.AAC.10
MSLWCPTIPSVAIRRAPPLTSAAFSRWISTARSLRARLARRGRLIKSVCLMRRVTCLSGVLSLVMRSAPPGVVRRRLEPPAATLPRRVRSLQNSFGASEADDVVGYPILVVASRYTRKEPTGCFLRHKTVAEKLRQAHAAGKDAGHGGGKGAGKRRPEAGKRPYQDSASWVCPFCHGWKLSRAPQTRSSTEIAQKTRSRRPDEKGS